MTRPAATQATKTVAEMLTTKFSKNFIWLRNESISVLVASG